ncbi:hypothetical protein [Priestia aryabhattai]|uniref:hypothetical protein n=1 Tax=Priestia aryabhattai TaxID=412384 RepID=UPI001C212D19|nr:hypothetical protein [Bacillus sp. FJAT-26377]
MTFFKDMSFKSFSIRWFISSVLLAGVLSLFYFRGFLKYYNLSSMFIDFPIEDIKLIFIYTLIAALIFIAFAVIIKLTVKYIPSVKSKKNNPIIFPLVLGLIFTSLVLLNELNINYPVRKVFGLYPVLPALLMSFLLIMMKKTLQTLPIIILAMLISITWANHIGEFNASHKENYLILKENKQDYAVLSNYNDSFIIAPVNLQTKFIESKFQIIDSNTDKLRKDMPDMSLNYKNTGELKVRPPITVD